MGSWFSKFWAKCVLGVLFIIHFFRKLAFWKKSEPGLVTFLGHFGGDGVYEVSKRERAQFPSYSKCHACSLCTFSCTAVRDGNAPFDFEPKFIMLGYGRSPHEAEYFLEEWLPCLGCKRCTVECPNDVPIHAMASQIIERQKKLGFETR